MNGLADISDLAICIPKLDSLTHALYCNSNGTLWPDEVSGCVTVAVCWESAAEENDATKRNSITRVLRRRASWTEALPKALYPKEREK